jgi:23S rRNA U2552 (ribose-2'-O)-methylase RlmE/FtsJ
MARKIDTWIIAVDSQGMHPPMHAFGKINGDFMCDKVANLVNGKIQVRDFDQPRVVSRNAVRFFDVDIKRVPDLAPIARRIYAAHVEHKTELAAALARTREKEDLLRKKIREDFAGRLALQLTLLYNHAESVLYTKAE